ncbi:MAG: DUF3461 family protein [Stappiaceae bacterium]
MDTPTLVDMGITSPGEISDFSVRNEASRLDVLTIYYKRKKLSVRPVRRTYEFGRSIKTVVSDSGSATMEETYELSPILQDAVKELQTVLGHNKLIHDPKDVVMKKLEDLQQLAEAGDNVPAITKQLQDIKKLLEDL